MSLQAEMFKHMLRRLLADQRISKLVVVEQEEWIWVLLRSHLKEPRLSGERIASRAQQNLTLRMSILISICGKVEGLDVTLDNPAGFADGFW